MSQSRIYTLDTKDLLVAASTSGQLGVALSIVGAGFSQIEQIISEEQIIRFVETNLPNSTSTTMVLLSIAAVIIISWLFSFVSTIIKYYDFVVEVREDELLITRGLFERTQLTIPFNRIQAVQIKEELLRQPLGYASLVIESAGYGEEQGNSTTLFPLIAKHRIFEFINEVIPEYNADISETTKPSPRGMRRYLFRMFWISLPIILTLWGTVSYGVYAWFLLIPALLLGYQQYRDAAISAGTDTLTLTSRLLSKTTAVVKKYRTQACEIRQNPFQSRLQLSNFTVHVAQR
ncbi:MAG: PH domain-containing protein [Fodinibius sp.]|nr:PH domain-containing protein [Fodinibius sp.]